MPEKDKDAEIASLRKRLANAESRITRLRKLVQSRDDVIKEIRVATSKVSTNRL